MPTAGWALPEFFDEARTLKSNLIIHHGWLTGIVSFIKLFSSKTLTNTDNSRNDANKMSGQYGEPDWANAAGSSTPVVDTTATTTTGNWASSGEDFSGAAAAATTNANVAGLSNASSG